MAVNRETLEKLGRFLLRGLRIGASTVAAATAPQPGALRLSRKQRASSQAAMMKVAELTDRRPGCRLSSRLALDPPARFAWHCPRQAGLPQPQPLGSCGVSRSMRSWRSYVTLPLPVNS
ncbi:MAG: hypothetical protein EA413_01115 [Cyanobium sp. PLM2.Bin73]|nr:MAG: hypothetical protein EA413_01115 [Cyanobium sp. PLM2.Bin73]